MQGKLRTPAIFAAGLAGTLALIYGAHQVLADGIPSRDPLYYSGYLSEDGKPVDGSRHIAVNLWSNSEARTGEVALCSSDVDATPVLQGNFRIALESSCKDAISATPETYVEVIVDGQTSLGRSKIGAVPYAVEAQRAQESGHTIAADSAQTAIAASGTLATQIVPSGAVLAFDLDACPAGWSAYAAARGRAVIGADDAYARGATPGEPTHTLSVAELPAHAHTTAVYNPTGAIASNGQTDLRVNGGALVASGYGSSIASAMTGGGAAFSNLQPSLALLYCRKD